MDRFFINWVKMMFFLLFTSMSNANDVVLQNNPLCLTPPLTSNTVYLNDSSLLFQTHFSATDWHGELHAYPLNAAGNVGKMLWDANCQLSGGYCATTEKIENGQNWDSRVILTSRPPQHLGETGLGVAFRWPNNPEAPSEQAISLQQVTAIKTHPLNGTLSDNTTGQQRLHHLRGAHIAGMRERNNLLGDILSSQPVYVGVPAFHYPDTLEKSAYTAFREAQSQRTPVIYVGANDGMLHGFNASASTPQAGKEVLAYLPSKVYSNLSALTHPDYGNLPAHRYYVDGSPTVGDAYLNGTWRTLLISGLGKGGQSLFALDITHPEQFSENNANQIVRWEFTDALDADLGDTFGRPALIRMANGQWMVVIGNGYHNQKADQHVSSTGHAVIYLLDAENGNLLHKFDTQTGFGSDPTVHNRANGIATVTPVDTNADHVIDYLYGPDLFGNLWKVDVRSENPANWRFAYGSSATPQPFFTAKSATNKNQPITAALDVSLHPTGKGQLLYFGTGQNIESDATQQSVPHDTQSFYALWDKNEATQPYIKRRHLLQQTIEKQTTHTNGFDLRMTSNHQIHWYSGAGTPTDPSTQGYLGWYLDLHTPSSNEKENVIIDPILHHGKIVLTTTITNNTACDAEGKHGSWLVILDAASGTPLPTSPFDLNGDGTLNTSDNLTQNDTASISGYRLKHHTLSAPTFIQKQQNNDELTYFNQASGDIRVMPSGLSRNQLGRQSWRQIFQ